MSENMDIIARPEPARCVNVIFIRLINVLCCHEYILIFYEKRKAVSTDIYSKHMRHIHGNIDRVDGPFFHLSQI